MLTSERKKQSRAHFERMFGQAGAESGGFPIDLFCANSLRRTIICIQDSKDGSIKNQLALFGSKIWIIVLKEDYIELKKNMFFIPMGVIFHSTSL